MDGVRVGTNRSICDAITHAPGTRAKTVAGLDPLAQRDVATRVDFVMCRDNADDFSAAVEFVTTRWPSRMIAAGGYAQATSE